MAQTGPVDDVMLRDPYEVLGVDKGATSQEIKSACELLHTFASLLQALPMNELWLRCISRHSHYACLSHMFSSTPGMMLLASFQLYLTIHDIQELQHQTWHSIIIH